MSEIAEQYRILAATAGWVERVDRGRLRVDGADGVSFLQSLLTNDIGALTAGTGAYAAYLTPQGRMIADMVVHHRGPYLLLDVAAAQAPSLAARLDQLIFTEDVRITDVSGTVAHLTVCGPTAAPVLAHALSIEAVEPERLTTLPLRGHLDVDGVAIVRTDETDLPTFDVFAPAAELQAARTRLDEMGAIRASADLLDALRIEAGHPVFGRDMDSDTIPLEAGLLERAISTTKGCYVGQEIVIRILHRGGGRVARRLAMLLFDRAVTSPPAQGTPLLHAGRDVGRITSAVVSPRTAQVVALGYVHRDHAEVGAQLTAQDGSSAEVVGFAG